MDRTGEQSIEPSAVVVGLSAAHVILCHEVIGEAGLRVEVTHGGLHAWCNEIAVVLPQVVVTSAGLGTDTLAVLEDAAVAVGAVFLVLGEGESLDVVALELEAAVVVASARVAYFSHRPPPS